jgi:hypothetical protein
VQENFSICIYPQEACNVVEKRKTNSKIANIQSLLSFIQTADENGGI